MPNGESVEAARHAYAEMLREKCGLRNERLVAAIATVPREDFLGRGPWIVTDLSLKPRHTPDDNPVHLCDDVLVSIDPARALNNGLPSRLIKSIDALNLREGDSAVHAGCGPGYYTALIASVVGERGRVVAYDIDADLAERAKSNLGSFANVEVHAADASKFDPGPADAILINAGATHPLKLWLDSMKEGGRMVFPLVRWPMGAIFGQGVAGWGAMLRVRRLAGRIFGSRSSAGRGAMMRVQRATADQYAASFVGPVGMFPCFGALDREADQLLEEAWSTPVTEVRSLRREVHEKTSSCWLHGVGYCFSKNEPG